MKPLHDALPIPFSDLKFHKIAISLRTNDLAPKGLGCCVGRHLADFPKAWIAMQGVQSQCAARARSAVSLEHKKLLHPAAFHFREKRWRNECDANVLQSIDGNMRVKSLVLPVAIQVVAVLAFGIGILRPNVGQLVLVELQQLLHRWEVLGLCLAELESHER